MNRKEIVLSVLPDNDFKEITKFCGHDMDEFEIDVCDLKLISKETDNGVNPRIKVTLNRNVVWSLFRAELEKTFFNVPESFLKGLELYGNGKVKSINIC